MKVTIGCSMRYREVAKETMSELTKLGITPLFPNLNYSSENGDAAYSLAKKKRLATEHYVTINVAD